MRNIVKRKQIIRCSKILLVSFGRPRPIETLSVFPEGFNRGKSEAPDAVKLRVRVPPPPQPSFFTATVMLQQKNDLLQC